MEVSRYYYKGIKTKSDLEKACKERGLGLQYYPGARIFRIMKDKTLLFSETSLNLAAKRVLEKPLIRKKYQK